MGPTASSRVADEGAAWRRASDRGRIEVIRRNGPWRNIEEVEFATLEWVDWFNNRRLFGPIGNIPPIEFEALYYERQETPAMVVGLT